MNELMIGLTVDEKYLGVEMQDNAKQSSQMKGNKIKSLIDRVKVQYNLIQRRNKIMNLTLIV
jgi:hypothetical protein